MENTWLEGSSSLFILCLGFFLGVLFSSTFLGSIIGYFMWVLVNSVYRLIRYLVSSNRSGLESSNALDIMYDPQRSLRTLINLQQTTHWMNYGYWKDTQAADKDRDIISYVKACESMVYVLGKHACLDPEDHVLDVGTGVGDQDLIWYKENGYFNVATIDGVELSHKQVQLANKKLGEHKDIKIIQGSATSLPYQDDSFSKVIALDCAYHFVGREDFFREAQRVLRPKGRLALVDMLFSGYLQSETGLFSALLKSIFSKLAKVPEQNMWTESTYTNKLQEAGFSEITIEDISHKVFPGFSRFSQRHSDELKDVVQPCILIQLKVFGWLAGWILKKGFMKCVIVTAVTE